MVRGRGLATVLHGYRGASFEAVTGSGLFPGTLNLALDRPFDWDAPHHRIEAPEPERWEALDGPWGKGGVRLYPVTLTGPGGKVSAWVKRLDSSRAADDVVELLAFVYLRALFGDGPVTLTLAER